MAAELATAYVTILPSTRGLGRALQRDLDKQVGGAGVGAGAAMGKGIGKGAKRLLKAGSLGAVALGAFTVKKGLDRALQIESAEAKLKGLGHTSGSVSKIMDSALASVKGTSFGLGEAATIAASAVAAGVKPGKELTAYLKQTADAATIAGADLGEMGGIINKVTTSGKVYTENLNQLSERGLPIFQWLQDEYGVSADRLRDMVRRGEVDSGTFNKVIRDNIGGAALESGKTTQGAFKNMLAAVGRVGEGFIGGFLSTFRGGFVELTGVIDSVVPVAERLGRGLKNAVDGFIDWIKNSEGVKTAAEGVRDFITELWKSFRDLWGALQGSGALDTFKGAIEGILKVGGNVLGFLSENADLVRNVILAYSGWKLGKYTYDLINNTIEWGKNTWELGKNLGATIASKIETGRLYGMYAADKIKLIATSTWHWIKNTGAILANKIQTGLLFVAQKVAAGGTLIMAGAQKVLNGAMRMNPVGLLITALILLVGAIILAWKKSETFRSIVLKVWGAIKKAAGIAWNFLKGVFTNIWGWIKDKLVPIFQTMGRVAKIIWNAIGTAIRWVWNNVIKPAFARLRAGLSVVRQAFGVAKDVISRVWRAVGNGVKWVWNNLVKPAFGKLRGGLDAVKRAFGVAKDFIGRVWGKITGLVKKPIGAAIGIINKYLIRPINNVARKLGRSKDLIGEINLKGFAEGGYTGRTNPRRVAGVVHGDEHVIRARSRRRLERRRPGALDWMNQTGTWPGYARGGRVRRVMPLRGARFSTYPGHTGVDLNAPNDLGKPVLAAAPGTVSRVVSLRKSYGKHVWVRMADGLSAIYAHLSAFRVKRGQRVSAGDQIGNVGSTGNSTGPHLHFEIRPQGTYAASKAFLQGALNLPGGVSGTGDGDQGQSWISKIVNAVKNVKTKLQGIGGMVGEVIRGSAAKLGSVAKGWVKNAVGDFFGGVIETGKNILGKIGIGPKSPGAAKKAARAALSDYGWGDGQWKPLEKLWTKESGWRWNADNPTSSAYGIPQALPGSKMRSAGKDWKTNPITQIKWGLRYIKQRYGSPAAAWAHSQRRGWYDQGGWLNPIGRRGTGRLGDTIAVNRSRKPEAVLSSRQWSLMKRWLPGKQTRKDKPVTLGQLEAMATRVLNRYGAKSRQYQRARRWAVDQRFNIGSRQWAQLKKWVPGLAKKLGKPEGLADMRRYVARIADRYGKRSPQYRQAVRLREQARYGGQYTRANMQTLRGLLPKIRDSRTAVSAAKSIQNLVTRVFGPHSTITRQVNRLAKRVGTAVTKIGQFNSQITAAKEAQAELSTNLRDQFRAEAFGNGLENLRLTLAANTNDAQAFSAALKSATRKGLSGGLLKALAASGDVQTAREIANLSAAQIAQLEKQWNQRDKITAQVGAQVAQMAYGPDIAALRRSIAQQNKVLRSLRGDLRQATYAGTKAGIQGTTRRAKAKKKTKGK